MSDTLSVRVTLCNANGDVLWRFSRVVFRRWMECGRDYFARSFLVFLVTNK